MKFTTNIFRSLKYHRQRECAYLNIGRYIVRVYKQYVRIAFFRDTSFVVNGVGAQTVGILYLPLSFGGGILFYKHHSRNKIRGCGMERKIAFIGHRHVYYADKVKERLQSVIEQCIGDGCSHFLMGAHGDFDQMALNACRSARKNHPDIQIEVVLISYHTIEKKHGIDYVPYQDVQTVMFDIEDLHFKQQITESNRQMIDGCDTLICYVDKKQSPSGAKIAMNYAKRKRLKIINLFREEDSPTFGMTADEAKTYWDNLFSYPHKPK